MRTLNVFCIEGEDALQSLRAEWNALLARSSSRSVFLTWEWLNAWWSVFRAGFSLRVICATDGTRLLGIFPLVRRERAMLDAIGLRSWNFLGTGESDRDEVCAYWMEPIVDNASAEAVYRRFLHYLVENERIDSWDQLRFTSIHEASPFVREAKRFFVDTCDVFVETAFTVGISDLGSSWLAFEEKLGSRTRKRLRRERRILEETPGFRYRFAETESDLDEMFRALTVLNRSRWGDLSPFASERFCEFQRVAIRALWPHGVRLSTMEIDGTIVAGNLDYCYKNTVYGYQTAFDAEYNPKIGIGTLSMVFCLDKAIQEGFAHYDWYRFDAGDYKEQFVHRAERFVNLTVEKKTFEAHRRRLVDHSLALGNKALRRLAARVTNCAEETNDAQRSE